MEEIRKIQAANPSEWEKVTAFLRERDLPVRREYADACFGAFIGGRLVGTVILSGSVVRNTAVDPEMRHKGIVEKLFTAVIEEARERGIFYLQLFTKSQNAEAFSGAGFGSWRMFRPTRAFWNSAAVHPRSGSGASARAA